MFDRRAVTAVLLAGVLAAGCSEGTTEPPATADPLSADEAVALFKAFEVFRNDSNGEATPAPLGGNVDVAADCPLGGQVRITGTASTPVSGDTLRIAMDLNIVPTACRLSREGLEFTVDGAPGVRDRFSVAFVASVDLFDIRVEGTTVGALDWQLADRSGRCAIDLALSGGPDLSAPEPTVDATYSGTLCGHTVEISAEDEFVPTG